MMSPSEAEGHPQGRWAGSSVCMRNGNDFWVILVVGYLHLLSPAFTQALRTDELRQERSLEQRGRSHSLSLQGGLLGTSCQELCFLAAMSPQGLK